MDNIHLSIIIVNYNVPDDVRKCILSLKDNARDIIYEVIVVDNNSVSGNIEDALKGLDHVQLLRLSANYGFGYACNQGMKIARGKYILLSNPDIIYEEDAAGKLYRFLESEPRAGAAGPVQTKPGTGIERYYSFFPGLYSRTMQESRLYMRAPVMKYRFNEFWDENIRQKRPFKVDWVMGSCLMLRAELYSSIGGFDEALFLFEEETQLQYRMNQKGWYSFVVPEARVVHDHHSSTGKLGKVFVYYHEFRSRLIFDSMRFKGLKYFFRRFQISSGLFLRVLYFKLTSSNETAGIKYRAYKDLLKLSLKSRKEILSDRYDFEGKLDLFSIKSHTE